MKEQFTHKGGSDLYIAVADEIDKYILMKLRDYRIKDSVGFMFEALAEMAKISAIMILKGERD